MVMKSKQPAKLAESLTEEKTLSVMSDSSLLPDSVSKLQLSSSPSAKMTQPATKEHTLSSWSLLPEELLHIISEKVENCFDIIHARSVCRQWRTIFPFPSCLLRTSFSLPSFAKGRDFTSSLTSYSLPSFAKGRDFPSSLTSYSLPLFAKGRDFTSSLTSYSLPSFAKGRDFCTLEKFPVFLFRIRAPAAATEALTSEFFVGGIGRDVSEDHTELPTPIQCSVKVKIQDSAPTLMNISDCQIIPLGYKCRMIGWDPESMTTTYRGVAFLPLDKQKGRGEFAVLIGYSHRILALRSAEMSWMRLWNISRADCSDIVTFRGKFYAVLSNGDVFAIDPYSLQTTLLRPSEIVGCGRRSYLVPCGDDELYLVERIMVRKTVLDFNKLACRVSRLDEEAGEWVVVTDLGDRVLLIGQPGNSSGNRACSAKELGVSGNSVLCINEIFDVTYPYRYGVDTGNPEDDLNFWRCSRETRVTILNKAPMVALRIKRAEP